MPTFTFDATTPAPTPDSVTDSVELLSSFPRGQYSSDFDVADDDYLKGLGFVAGIVIALAVFLILIYIMFLCARCCCKCCKFSVEDLTQHEERCTPAQQRAVLVVWLLLTATMMCCSFIGRNQFVAGASDMADSAESLGDTFSALETQGDELATSSSDMNATLARIDCYDESFVDDLDTYVSAFSDAIADLSKYWTGLDSKFYRVSDVIAEDGTKFIDYGIGATVAVVLVVCALGIFADVCSVCCVSSYVLFNVASFLGVVVCLFLAVLVAFELALSVGLSDFCVAGVDASFTNLLKEQLNMEGENLNLVDYYIYCDGVNPLFSSLNSSIMQLEGINTTVTTVLSTTIPPDDTPVCEPKIDVRGLGAISIETLGTLDDIQGTIGCSAINPVYQQLTYELLCVNVVDGLYWLWSIQVTAAFMLYLGLFIISYTKEKVILQRDADKGEGDAAPGRLGGDDLEQNSMQMQRM